MEIQLTWGDTFDVTVIPAISADDGLEVGPDVMSRRQFLRVSNFLGSTEMQRDDPACELSS